MLDLVDNLLFFMSIVDIDFIVYFCHIV